jgi:hypothetical protein
MMDISHILLDPELATPTGFDILRTVRAVDSDGMITGEVVAVIPAEGVVVPSGNVGQERMPETEKTTDVISIYTKDEIKMTDYTTGAPADDVVWHGQRYQITKCDDWSDFGFYAAEGHLQGTGEVNPGGGGGPII